MSARGGKKKGAKKKATSWRCSWCHSSKTSYKAQGPKGPKTLCGRCNQRWRNGETGPRSDDWTCDWCGADDSQTPRRCKGPEGPGTLCATCGARQRDGATGPPAENWRCDWCGTGETRERRMGPKGRETLCQPCGDRFGRGKTGPLSPTFECRWCGATTGRQRAGPTGDNELCDSCGSSYARASDKIKARLVHVETELVRLTSVPVFDVDAGTETRGPAPKRACDDAPASGLKALKAATDATAVDLGRVKREKEALEDRLLCTICMEADAPRTVLFGPCNHFLAWSHESLALAGWLNASMKMLKGTRSLLLSSWNLARCFARPEKPISPSLK